MNPEILINGRFQYRPLSGVERYARAVTAQLEDRTRLLAPGRALSGLTGHLWEQLVLPRSLPPGSLLWSPANSGPLLAHSQVVTIHDLAPLDHPEWYQPAFVAWYRMLMPGLAQRAVHIITQSNFSKKRVLARLGVPAVKVTVIPEGVDLAIFRPAPQQVTSKVLSRLGISSPYLLAVGALPGRKNLERLLEAWKMILPIYPEMTLAVVGSRGRVFLVKTELEVSKRVRWLGYLEDRDLAALYSGALALLYPSLYEGFGLCLLEAMACGTPVLCSTAGALPEVAGEAALQINCRDTPALAAGLHRLIADPSLRADLRLKGLERAQEFRWEQTAQLVWSVLTQAREAIALDSVCADVGWSG